MERKIRFVLARKLVDGMFPVLLIMSEMLDMLWLDLNILVFSSLPLIFSKLDTPFLLW